MSFETASSLGPRLLLRTLFLLALFSWPLSVARAQDVVRLTLDITVTDQAGKPIPNARISIPRQGQNSEGQPLGDIEKTTDSNGKFVKNETDFQLTGTPHKITVAARELSPPLERVLSDDELRKANNGTLVLTLSPHRDPDNVVRLTINGQVTGPDGRPIPNAKISIPRRGTDSDGRDLEEITTNTNNKGEFSTGAEFHLDGVPQRLTVTASGFDPLNLDLPDDWLRRGARETVLKLQPIKLSVQQSPSSFFQSLKDIVNHVIWWLGVLFLLVLLWVLVRRIYKRGEKHNGRGYTEAAEAARARAAHARTSGMPPGWTPGHGQVPGEGFSQIDWSNTVNTIYGIKQQMVTGDEFRNRIAELKAAIIEYLPRTGGGGTGGTQSGERESLADSTGHEATPFTSDRVEAEEPRRARVEGGALASYRDLSNSIPVTPEPIYLNVEGARSMAGKLEDDNVYLEQVSHSQGTFVLLANSGKSGWVFPNPKLPFRQAALKEVFPALTETEFEAAKGNIEPKRAKKVEEGRWVVES